MANARAKADEARARMMDSFDDLLRYGQQLQERLAPSHLIRDAWDAAKDKGADMAEDAVDAVRKRPVAATGAIAALALFIAREPLMDLANKLVNGKGKKPKRARKARNESMETINE